MAGRLFLSRSYYSLRAICCTRIKEGSGKMSYIMENSLIEQQGREIRTAIAVKNNTIYTIDNPVARLNWPRVDLAGYRMAPAFVMLSEEIPESGPDMAFFSRYARMGTGTLIIPVRAAYCSQTAQAIKAARDKLKESPIDYVLALQVPQHLLTSGLMHMCKKEKIPLIMAEITSAAAMAEIGWSWIRAAAFPYNPLIAPVFPENTNPQQIKELDRLLTKEKIHHLDKAPRPNEPIKLDILKKIGLYPYKGVIRAGGELNYNLYESEEAVSSVNGAERADYDKIVITVLKGKVIRAGSLLELEKCSGTEFKVKVPGFFI